MKPTLKVVSMDELSPLITGLIKSGTDVTFTVRGVSMQPTFRHLRDTVVLTDCEPENLKKGQIPLYLRENGKYVLHRIIKVNENSYDMCGDHQIEVEKNVPKSAVLCVVKGFTRKGKYHDCNDPGYKLYSSLWMLSRPLRNFMFFIHRLPKKLFKQEK